MVWLFEKSKKLFALGGFVGSTFVGGVRLGDGVLPPKNSWLELCRYSCRAAGGIWGRPVPQENSVMRESSAWAAGPCFWQ